MFLYLSFVTSAERSMSFYVSTSTVAYRVKCHRKVTIFKLML